MKSAFSTLTDRVLSGFAILVIVLMLAISLQVLCAMLDINPVVSFDRANLLIGKAITLNSLLDFQWHLLAMIALLPAGLVWWRDGHVRVDFFYAGRSDRQKSMIELTGHTLLTAPFLFLCVPASWAFLLSAWRSDQGSTNDGLSDLWLIKATLPLGLALLCVVLLADAVRQIRRL